jgi:hypothetical protein
MIMSRVAIAFGCLLCVTPAFAQTYVSAALGVDLRKSYESSVNGTTFPDGEDAATSWGLRVGTALGSRWGVELDFSRPDEVDMQNGPIVYAPAQTAIGFVDVSPTILPAPEIHSSQRSTTWNTSAWIRQSLGARADLVFLGGLGFSRVVQNTEYSINVPPQLLSRILAARPSYRTRTIGYGVGPLVGAEARLRMTEHLELIPGIRAQSLGNNLSDGLVLRPSVALSWTF